MVHPLGGFPLELWEDVRVRIHRQGDLGMTQDVHHDSCRLRGTLIRQGWLPAFSPAVARIAAPRCSLRFCTHAFASCLTWSTCACDAMSRKRSCCSCAMRSGFCGGRSIGPG